MAHLVKQLFAAFLVCVAVGHSPTLRAEKGLVVPSPRQVAWAEAEMGVIIHFDMPVFHPGYNWRKWGSHPPASSFAPNGVDVEQWVLTAKRLGANYAVLVAKHCSGFSLWPTAAHDYDIAQSPYKDGKGDIVREFVDACRKHGLKPGLYASTTANGYLWVNNPGRVQKGGPVTQEQYNTVVETQLRELWGNYGPLFEVWFDGGVLARDKGGADVAALLTQLQPQAIAFQGPPEHTNLVRWVGNEHGTAPDPCWATCAETTKADGTRIVEGLHGDPDGTRWCPGEADFTLRHNSSFQGGWFWRKGQDNRIFTVPELMKKYEETVGRNTNMLLGIVIDDHGRVPEADCRRLAEFADAIRARYGTPLKTVSGKGATVELRLDAPTAIDRAILQEEIAQGERVLAYELEGREGDAWVPLAKGTNIGHKRIATFAPRTLSAVRLRVTRFKAEPRIRALSVFTKQ